jgi:hypothetical protein
MCFLWGTNWICMSQKTTFFIVTAVKTSNNTYLSLCWRGTKRVPLKLETKVVGHGENTEFLRFLWVVAMTNSLLRYKAVWSGKSQPSFRKKTLPPSTGSKYKHSKKSSRRRQEEGCACFMLVSLWFRNVNWIWRFIRHHDLEVENILGSDDDIDQTGGKGRLN